MKNYLLLVLVAHCFFWTAKAQETVTFSSDIASIIYNNCSTCHRPGEIGPMPLTNFEEIRGWGSVIEYVTSIKYMPPWKPNRDYSSFLGERYLTDQEIEKISQWVNSGMPRGNAEDEPSFPDFPKGSQVGEPDLVLSFSQPYLHKGNNKDQYQIIVLPTGLQEDKILKAIELRPGNSKIVHHALFANDASGEAKILDAETPEYGYPGFGGFGVEASDNYPGYVPGARARIYPEGIGQTIKAGSDLLVQMHYAPVPADEKDSSTVNLFFADANENITRFVHQYIMLPFGNTLTNGPFIIQANQKKTFHGVYKVPFKVSLLGIAPHMHLLGKDWKVFTISPQGDTTNLIHIPEWDFNWQGLYNFKKFMVLERGTEIHAYATYDNTVNNPYNPNNPPKFVTWGEGTEDEMFYLPFAFVEYRSGDENVSFEEGTVTSVDGMNLKFPDNKLYPVFPNPARDNIVLGFSLNNVTNISLELIDINGRMVKSIIQNDHYPPGLHQIKANVGDLPPGTYYARLTGKNFVIAKPVSVLR